MFRNVIFFQNAAALSLCEAPVQTSYGFSQARTLASLQVNPNPVAPPSRAVAEQEKHVRISDFEDITVCKKPFHKKVLMKIVEHSELHPTRVALSLAEDPSKRITYMELHQQTYGLASFLLNKGVGHLDVCCNVLPNCIEYVPAYLGTMMLGAISMGADVNCTKGGVQSIVDRLNHLNHCFYRRARHCTPKQSMQSSNNELLTTP
ncbi:hypothetical protein OESDEN_12042 [Oesophagostomum dentatum]|uniref:AMP-dependent synthetase/ligase domain-containing protein n=1 Tax=Oesophagostomum dentatum TaxID=61180 RepID=A0A0B1SXF4_OESDE|nr:hypothetical protein OESDEN_12042 [Oesophagostomum dentatum]